MLLLKLSVLTTLLYSLYHWTMRGNTFFLFNRFSLIGGIVLTLVLPFIPIYYRTVAIDSAVLSEETFQIGNAIIIKMKVNEVTDIGRIITLGYFSGIMFLMLSRGWSIFRLLAHISKGIKTTVSGFTLVESVAVSSSFSFLHYIVLPQGMNEVDKQVILIHEKTHVRQHHYIDLFLGDIFCIIQWFNPFAWFYKRDMIENHEFLADRAASHVSGMDVYKDTLTRYWLYGSMKSLVNPFAYSTRLMRLSMLKKPSSLTVHKCWLVCLLPLLALYAWAFAEPRDIISEAEREVTVTGIVTDEEGNHVIAASVLCPEKGIGTISDADGRYVVTIGKNDTIHIQMSGYQSRKVCIGNREIKDCKTTINVQLNH